MHEAKEYISDVRDSPTELDLLEQAQEMSGSLVMAEAPADGLRLHSGQERVAEMLSVRVSGGWVVAEASTDGLPLHSGREQVAETLSVQVSEDATRALSGWNGVAEWEKVSKQAVLRMSYLLAK